MFVKDFDNYHSTRQFSNNAIEDLGFDPESVSIYFQQTQLGIHCQKLLNDHKYNTSATSLNNTLWNSFDYPVFSTSLNKNLLNDHNYEDLQNCHDYMELQDIVPTGYPYGRLAGYILQKKFSLTFKYGRLESLQNGPEIYALTATVVNRMSSDVLFMQRVPDISVPLLAIMLSSKYSALKILSLAMIYSYWRVTSEIPVAYSDVNVGWKLGVGDELVEWAERTHKLHQWLKTNKQVLATSGTNHRMPPLARAETLKMFGFNATRALSKVVNKSKETTKETAETLLSLQNTM